MPVFCRQEGVATTGSTLESGDGSDLSLVILAGVGLFQGVGEEAVQQMAEPASHCTASRSSKV